jgi:hypothetical protein
MEIESDILKRIGEEFSSEDTSAAVEMLTASRQSGRVARCIVFLAKGNLKEFRHYIDIAVSDYEDVILMAEYDDVRRRVRNFTSSFLIDSQVKMWVAGIAGMLQQRGYLLVSFETVPVAKHWKDLGEGTATFTGNVGPLTVVKRQGNWTLEGDKSELELFDLAEPVSDELKFIDAVSCYLLAKQNPRPLKRQIQST